MDRLRPCHYLIEADHRTALLPSTMPLQLQKGDLVRIRRDPTDDWCSADVIMISENGRSLALMLASGMVREGGGFHAGFLPLSYNPDTDHFLGLKGDIYQIEKAKSA